jgi:hypothetical protein
MEKSMRLIIAPIPWESAMICNSVALAGMDGITKAAALSARPAEPEFITRWIDSKHSFALVVLDSGNSGFISSGECDSPDGSDKALS